MEVGGTVGCGWGDEAKGERVVRVHLYRGNDGVAVPLGGLNEGNGRANPRIGGGVIVTVCAVMEGLG
jgi:hypothetical protein